MKKKAGKEPYILPRDIIREESDKAEKAILLSVLNAENEKIRIFKGDILELS